MCSGGGGGGLKVEKDYLYQWWLFVDLFEEHLYKVFKNYGSDVDML
jgi:hypothetical protein